MQVGDLEERKCPDVFGICLQVGELKKRREDAQVCICRALNVCRQNVASSISKLQDNISKASQDVAQLGSKATEVEIMLKELGASTQDNQARSDQDSSTQLHGDHEGLATKRLSRLDTRLKALGDYPLPDLHAS